MALMLRSWKSVLLGIVCWLQTNYIILGFDLDLDLASILIC